MVRLFERYQVNSLINKTQLETFSYRESRTNLDTQETYKSFGPLIIDFSKIQSKIGVKYDNWHQDLLRKFGQIIQTVATDFHSSISEVISPCFSSSSLFNSFSASNETRNEIN